MKFITILLVAFCFIKVSAQKTNTQPVSDVQFMKLTILDHYKGQDMPSMVVRSDQPLKFATTTMKSQDTIDTRLRQNQPDWKFLRKISLTEKPFWQRIKTASLFSGEPVEFHYSRQNRYLNFSNVIYSPDATKAFLTYFSVDRMFKQEFFVYFEKSNRVWRLQSREVVFLY